MPLPSQPQPVMDQDQRLAQQIAALQAANQSLWRMFETVDSHPLRLIWGVGSGGGGIYSGGGWSVVRFAAGVYIITWTLPFAAAPVVIGQQYASNVNNAVLLQPRPTSTGCQLQTTNISLGSNVDVDYGFVAIGPVS